MWTTVAGLGQNHRREATRPHPAEPHPQQPVTKHGRRRPDCWQGGAQMDLRKLPADNFSEHFSSERHF
jgi:hypothetical protein